MSSASTTTPEIQTLLTKPTIDKPTPPLSRADRMQDRLKGKIKIVGDIVSPIPELDLEFGRTCD